MHILLTIYDLVLCMHAFKTAIKRDPTSIDSMHHLCTAHITMKVTCFALLFSVSCILAVADVTLPDDLEEAFLQQALISEPGAKDIEDLEEQILRQATMNAEERKVATSTSKKDLEKAYLQQAKKDFEEVQLEQGIRYSSVSFVLLPLFQSNIVSHHENN